MTCGEEDRQISAVDTPIGSIKIETTSCELVRLIFTAQDQNLSVKFPGVVQGYSFSQIVVSRLDCSSVFMNTVIEQLQQYFIQPSFKFSIPILLQGTPFQLKVWELLKSIPVGTVLTYGEIAKKLQTSPRAVGNACRANPVPIVIPCHRVINKKGYGGFCGQTSGEMFAVKQWLLQHEGK